MIYFDNAATTKISSDIASAMARVNEEYFANPSSVHSEGRKSRRLIERCRTDILNLCKADYMDLFFTSGATESNNLAIKGFCKGKSGNIISLRIEHESVLQPLEELKAEGFSVTYIDINSEGQIDFTQLKNAIRRDTILMTFSIVNNETGIIQKDYLRIVELCKKNNIAVHTDAVQTFGHLDVDYSIFDMVTFTAHKIHGPRGIAALLVKKNIKLDSQILGGGQENGLRGGTENTAAIYGFYLSVKKILKNMNDNQISAIKKRIINGIKKIVPDAILNSDENSIPQILNVTLPFDGDTILTFLDSKGVLVSSGSACLNNGAGYSHVIYELTKSEMKARNSIRLSFSLNSTMEEAERFITVFSDVICEIKGMEACCA